MTIFENYICGFFENRIFCCQFPSVLKRANITLVFIKLHKLLCRKLIKYWVILYWYYIKDTLKSFGDFKSKQKSVWSNVFDM